MILWSGYIKLAFLRSKPTTNWAITNWAIRPCAHLALRANFASYSNSVVSSVSDFILAIAFVSRHVYFNRLIVYFYHISIVVRESRKKVNFQDFSSPSPLWHSSEIEKFHNFQFYKQYKLNLTEPFFSLVRQMLCNLIIWFSPTDLERSG